MNYDYGFTNLLMYSNNKHIHTHRLTRIRYCKIFFLALTAQKTLSTNENSENKNKENTFYIPTASKYTHTHTYISPIYTPYRNILYTYVYNLGKWLCMLRRCFRCYWRCFFCWLLLPEIRGLLVFVDSLCLIKIRC